MGVPGTVAVLAKTLWGAGPQAPSGGGAIISSQWKNWGPGEKVRGPRPPSPGLERPLTGKQTPGPSPYNLALCNRTVRCMLGVVPLGNFPVFD